MHKSLFRYLSNCILLTIPALLWNLLFMNRLPPAFLPDIFWHNIPPLVAYGENISRLLLFFLPVLMPLQLVRRQQKTGMALYIIGTLIYFLSWIPLMFFPESAWSMSAVGFLAPAYTPLIWAIGIGLIGDELYISVPYRSWMYIALSVVFVLFHLSHTTIVYMQNF